MRDLLSRIKRLRVLMEELLSSDEEDDAPSGLRRMHGADGICRRHVGWHPTPHSSNRARWATSSGDTNTRHLNFPP